jgi:hypothetical protein
MPVTPRELIWPPGTLSARFLLSAEQDKKRKACRRGRAEAGFSKYAAQKQILHA